MFITDYSDLESAIEKWLDTTALGDEIPYFIALGEARLNRTLRLLQMETAAAVPLGSSQDSAAYPARFIDLISLNYTDTHCDLEQVTPAALASRYRSASARPGFFGTSDRFLFNCPADQGYSLNCRYFASFDLEDDDTNWLLVNAPDAYVFSALCEAEPFIDNSERIPIWESKLQRAINELNSRDAKVRAGAPLRVDAGLLGGGTFDIRYG